MVFSTTGQKKNVPSSRAEEILLPERHFERYTNIETFNLLWQKFLDVLALDVHHFFCVCVVSPLNLYIRLHFLGLCM